MPVLSLHNTYSLPSGSASYTLGLSGAPGASSYTYPTVGSSGVSNVLGTGLTGTTSVGAAGVSSILGTSGLSGVLGTTTNPLTSTTLPLSLSAYNPTSSYSTYTNPLLSSAGMNIKLKPLEELELGVGRYGRSGTPCSPIPPTSWGLDSFGGIDGVNPAFMHTQRPLSRLDLESKCFNFIFNLNFF